MIKRRKDTVKDKLTEAGDQMNMEKMSRDTRQQCKVTSLKRNAVFCSRNVETQVTYLNEVSAVLCLVAQSCPTLCDPMDFPPGPSVHGDSPGKNTGVAMPSSRGSSQLRDRTQASCTAVDSLSSEPPGKQMKFRQLEFVIVF